MANPAAEARARLLAKFPEAIVVERGRYHIKHRLADGSDGRQRFVLDCWLPPIAGGAPDTTNDQVDASTDDAYELESSGAMNLTGSSVIIRSDTQVALRYWGGFRFHNGPFPAQGSTIDVAYLSLSLYYLIYDDVNCDISAQDAAAPTTFTTTAFNISGRTRTSASVAWVADGLGAGWKDSPSIVSVIQELADDYTSTAIAFILKPKTDVTKELRADSYDEGAAYAAKLHIEYTTGAAAIASLRLLRGVGR